MHRGDLWVTSPLYPNLTGKYPNLLMGMGIFLDKRGSSKKVCFMGVIVKENGFSTI